jgi:hypothetical protein
MREAENIKADLKYRQIYGLSLKMIKASPPRNRKEYLEEDKK